MQTSLLRFQGHYTLPKTEDADWPLNDEAIYRTLRMAREKAEQRKLRQVSLSEGKFPVFFTIPHQDGYAVLCPDEFDKVVEETFTEIRDTAHQTGNYLPEFKRHDDTGEISRTTYAVFHAICNLYGKAFLNASTSLRDLQEKVKYLVEAAQQAIIVRSVT